MGFLTRAGGWLGFGRKGDQQNLTDITELLLNSLGYSTKSGVTVSAESALRVAAVLACVRVLAEGVAQVPFKLMQETSSGDRIIAKGHPVHYAISTEPNEWDTSFTFRETMMYHAVLTGNAYAYINRVRGEVYEIIPIPPGRVRVDRLDGYTLTYTITDERGVIGTFPPDSVLHLRGPSWNGYTGLDVVGLSRDAIGLAIALEASHAAAHKNGLRPSLALTHEKGQTEDQIKRVKALLNITHGGVGNAFKPLFLDNGWKLEKLTMNGLEAQHLETRKHQLEEICRMLRVFPQMIGASDKTSTYASAEQFFIAHVIHSLCPWMERFEQAANQRLLTRKERREGYYTDMVTEGLLRGDSRARAAFYQVMVLTGILTRNECREKEDLNKIEGLDEPLVPLNMGLAGETGGEAGSDGAGKGPALPNMPIAPMSLVNKLMGHNGGPPLDDDGKAAVAAQLPRLEALRAGDDKLNVGRVLSGENEALIRGASDNLTTVLGKLGSEEAGDD